MNLYERVRRLFARPANDNPWTASDEADLRERRARHERSRTLAARKRTAVHDQLAREVWGGGKGWRGTR